MKKPKMILFDMGQTLIKEEKIDYRRGNAALLEYAVENKHGYGLDEVCARADEITREISSLGGYEPERRSSFELEVPCMMFDRYLFESLGIRLSLTAEETESIFWDAAAPGRPTEGVEELLEFLRSENIRTGVVSNISYSEKTVCSHINKMLPHNSFEFIMTSSAYIFRKPNRMIFEIAKEKAGLDGADIWYVGDRYEFDAVGALKAEMFPVIYTGANGKTGETHDDVLTVAHWSELEEYIKNTEN